MNILITNDDGFDSPFLPLLIDAIRGLGNIFVCTPRSEESWVGSKIKTPIQVIEKQLKFCKQARSIENGTPIACIDIAIHHLLHLKPDLVISGVNIGANTSWQYILSSGTVAGAFHANSLSIPSLAISQSVNPQEYEYLKNRQPESPINENLCLNWRKNFANLPELILKYLASPKPSESFWNVNLPYSITEKTKQIFCQPSLFSEYQFYLKDKVNNLCFSPQGKEPEFEESTDRQILRSQNIPISVFNSQSFVKPSI
jgi:5'/3'-nucleotidase SurE